MLVKPVDEERHPADTGFEEGHAQGGVAVEDPTPDQGRLAVIWSNGKLTQCT